MKEKDRIKEAKMRLMMMKNQDNVKDIVFIDAVLSKYARVVKEICD